VQGPPPVPVVQLLVGLPGGVQGPVFGVRDNGLQRVVVLPQTFQGQLGEFNARHRSAAKQLCKLDHRGIRQVLRRLRPLGRRKRDVRSLLRLGHVRNGGAPTARVERGGRGPRIGQVLLPKGLVGAEAIVEGLNE